MAEAAIGEFLLPDDLVEQFVTRLRVRLLDPPEISNRELAMMLAQRLGMTRGPCRVRLELQDGLCKRIMREDIVPGSMLDEAEAWPE